MQARSTGDGRRYHSFGAFLLGAAAGGIAGLLLAPMAGRDLRGKISEETKKAKDEAAEVAQRTQERATEMAGKARAKAREAYSETTDRARKAVDDTKVAAQVQKEALREAWQEGKAAYERELAKSR